METTVQRLRYMLLVLAAAVSGKKATLPILQNVVVGQGRAWATNLETAITVEFPEAVDDLELLPHQQVLNLLKHIPGSIPLSINREGSMLKLMAGSTSASFPMTEKATDFPPLSKLQPVGEGQVDADLFLRVAVAVAGYTATENSRPVLQCVCVTLGAPLEMAGADGFRLAWQTIPMALPALNSPAIYLKQLLIPATAVHTLAKLWKVMEKQSAVDPPTAGPSANPLQQDGDFRLARAAVAKRMATIQFSNIALSFQHGAVTVRTQLTQGEFPNYSQLIPTDLPHRVTFDAEETLRAVRSLALVAAGDGSGMVRLQWASDRLMFSGQAAETGAISASVRAHIQGDEARIAFDSRYLLGYLKGKMGMVLLETAAPSSPARFYHSGSPDVILMPMFAKWGDAAPADESTPVDEASPSAEGEEDVPEVDSSGEEPEAAPAPAAAKPRSRAKSAKQSTTAS